LVAGTSKMTNESTKKLSEQEELKLWEQSACGRHNSTKDEDCFDLICQYCSKTFKNLRDLSEKIMELSSENEELKIDAIDEDRLRTRLAELLTGTANALHGGPLKNGSWSWHDLPVLAEQAIAKIKELESKHE
jgi:hypothetical protein